LDFIAQAPAALHLPGEGQPAHGLNPPPLPLPDAIFLPYIMSFTFLATGCC
jgi:hypothetical protein